MAILNHPRMEVPSDFFSTTSEEKWRTGRWSPEGDGGAEGSTFIFEQEDLISVTGVSSWWCYFAQGGGTPLIIAGIKILATMLHLGGSFYPQWVPFDSVAPFELSGSSIFHFCS